MIGCEECVSELSCNPTWRLNDVPQGNNALLKVSLNIPFFGLEEYGMQKELRKRLVSVHNLIENFEIARKR